MISPKHDLDQVNEPVMKRIREALGLSQEKFARLIGCSYKKISRSENGSEIFLTVAEAKNLNQLLREHFGVDIEALPDDIQNGELPFLD